MSYKVLAPCIFQYDFPKDFAEDLVKMFDDIEEDVWKKSGVGSANSTEQEIRTSKEFAFEIEMPISGEKTKQYFINAVDEYCQINNLAVTQDERLQLLKYSGNEKYNYHSDSDWGMYRTVSGLIYLNPHMYEGGETHFKHFDIDVKPELPAIVLFPSNYAYYHMAKPVIKGTKYILVTWMNDMPVGFSPFIISNIANSVGASIIQQHQH